MFLRAVNLTVPFDRHVTADLRITSEVDLTHAARANLRADFVATETCARWNSQQLMPAKSLPETDLPQQVCEAGIGAKTIEPGICNQVSE